MTSLAMFCTSTYAFVFTSPLSTVSPVVTNVSHATFASLSCARKLSNSASEIWSATLSGCPSETDSEVKKYAIFSVFVVEKTAAAGILF